MTGRRDAGFIPALDGLRGIAILLVMLHHFTYIRPTEGIDLAIGSVVFFWWTGVDLFFVLSGFLITGILLDTRGSAHYFTNFYARRILRIVPLYYLVLFLAFVVVPRFPTLHLVIAGEAELPPRWPYWFFMSNVWIAQGGWHHGWADVSWSLAIEEHFYLVWPLLIWWCSPRVLALLCAAILVAEPAARTYVRLTETTMQSLPVFVLTWFRLDGLAIGALLALAQRRGLLPALDRWVPVVAIATVCGLLVCVHMGGHTWWWNRWMQQYGYSLIAIGSGAMLVSAVNRPADSRWPAMLSVGWLRAFGKYSYALYLLHPSVQSLIHEDAFKPEQSPGIAPWTAQLLFYVLATAPAFALAWLSWRLFEAPILKLKAWFPLDRATPPRF